MDGLILAAPPAADDYAHDIADRAAEVDRSCGFPWEGLDILQRERVRVITARREDGGEAAGLGRVSDLVRHVGRGCASAGLILAMPLIHLRHAARSGWPVHLSLSSAYRPAPNRNRTVLMSGTASLGRVVPGQAVLLGSPRLSS